MPNCPECGAELGDSSHCDDLFHQVLAWEWTDPPRTAANHHLLVMCWELQHPSRFSEPTLEWGRETLRRVLREGLTHERLRAEMRGTMQQQDRDFKITRTGAPMVLRRWSATLADVVAEGVDAMSDSIIRWATAVAEDLDRDDS